MRMTRMMRHDPFRAVLVLSLAASACVNADVRLYELALRGRVTVADALPTGGQVQLELHHAEGGVGMFAHPLGVFADFADVGAPGEMLEVRARVPIDEGSLSHSF